MNNTSDINMASNFGKSIQDREIRGPVSQQAWYDKDPSLLKGPKRRG
jgi:hypothetical protein